MMHKVYILGRQYFDTPNGYVDNHVLFFDGNDYSGFRYGIACLKKSFNEVEVKKILDTKMKKFLKKTQGAEKASQFSLAKEKKLKT